MSILYEGMSFDQSGRQAKKDRLKKKNPDIDFVTENGTKVRLIFNGSEYRAYEMTGGGKLAMNLGAIRIDNLVKYIKQNF